MSRLRWLLITCTFAGGASAVTGVAAPPAPPLPEARLLYNFQPGDCVTYEHRCTLARRSTGERTAQSREQVRLWCLTRQGDTARLLIDVGRIDADRVVPAHAALVELQPTGQLAPPPNLPPSVQVLPIAACLLAPLRSAVQDDSAWISAPDAFGRRWRCERIGPDQRRRGEVQVRFRLELPLRGRGDAIEGAYWFDPAAGLITRVEQVSDSGVLDERRETVIILRDRRRWPATWTDRRAREAESFVQALRRSQELHAQALRSPGELDQCVERLERLWRGTQQEFEADSGSPFLALGRAQFAALAAAAAQLRARAAYVERWIGRTAGAWSLQDFQGQPLSSEHALGRPVLELWWRSDDPLAARMLTALHEVQAELAPRGIVVQCLNLDPDTPLAQRLRDDLPPGPVHVLAAPLARVDTPPALPMLRLLDHAGVVRRVWFGWPATLEEPLAEARRLAP